MNYAICLINTANVARFLHLKIGLLFNSNILRDPSLYSFIMTLVMVVLSIMILESSQLKVNPIDSQN